MRKSSFSIVILLLLHSFLTVKAFSAGNAIDMVKLKVLSERWLANGCVADDWCSGADITHSGHVDLIDYAFLAANREPFASNPNPSDGSAYAPINTVLEWIPGSEAQSHNIYFGTDFNDVNDANSTVTLGVYKGNYSYSVTDYNTNGLDPNTIYYLRIHEIDSSTNYKGEVSSFRRGRNNDITFFFVADTHYSKSP